MARTFFARPPEKKTPLAIRPRMNRVRAEEGTFLPARAHFPLIMIPPYLHGIDPDLREVFFTKLRVLWTHNSTALEGNTLTAGETLEVLTRGLTISGKPLADHNEVVGHSRAIDLVFEWCLGEAAFAEADLFRLHAAVQTRAVFDSLNPVAAWKVEPNAAAIVIDGQPLTNDTYASPVDVPVLMAEWFAAFRSICQSAAEPGHDRIRSHAWLHAAFVRVHPFADGNGRLARLVANLPLIRSDWPPVTIPVERRIEYIETLARWQLAVGRPRPGACLVPETPEFEIFVDFCREATQAVIALIEETRQRQHDRDAEKASG
jgi:hypothetical protein